MFLFLLISKSVRISNHTTCADICLFSIFQRDLTIDQYIFHTNSILLRIFITEMIGEKIKAARIEKGLTAKELAIKSEVTPGYISQIERELISPSLSVLMRIAKVLEIPIVSLFSQEEQEQVTVIKKDNRTKIRFADINMEYQFVTPFSRTKNTCTQMEIICFCLGPKAGAVPKCSSTKKQRNVYLLQREL